MREGGFCDRELDENAPLSQQGYLRLLSRLTDWISETLKDALQLQIDATLKLPLKNPADHFASVSVLPKTVNYYTRAVTQ